MSGTFKATINKAEQSYLMGQCKVNKHYLDYLRMAEPDALATIRTRGQDRIDVFIGLIQYLQTKNQRHHKQTKK